MTLNQWLACSQRRKLRLEGDHPVDLSTAEAALAPDFIAGAPEHLRVALDEPDWQGVDRAIGARVSEILQGGDIFDFRLAVFALAPVSACVSLGYHLTNRPHVRLFQYHRDERTWVWPRQTAPAQDLVISGMDSANQRCRSVSFLFHLSAEISDTALAGLGNVQQQRIDFRVPLPSTACLQHPDQIKWIAFEARQAFERAAQLYRNATVWHLSGPAPIAVALGQQVNPTMCPQVQLYEYRHREQPQYKASIRLGG
jgi:SMODS-associated and fused to various effectors sensor domain